MSKQIAIDHYGVSGRGRTIKEAKADAGRRIQEMLTGDYSPHVVTYRGFATLVYREPFSGWCTRNIADEDGMRGGTTGGSCHGYADQYEAMKAARMSVAQLSWTEDDGLLPPNFLPEREAREFVAWARFQIEYRRLRAEGVPEVDCHRRACEAMAA
jgi:hypothetical protein